jgi:hypothetical protein
MTAIETLRGILDRARRAPRLVQAGALGGVATGTVAGIILSSAGGMVFAVLLGGVVGALAGGVMDGDAKRERHRTRELDDIIGVTGGSLGAPPSLPSPGSERDEELASWLTEWMTPPAPRVG